MALAVGAGVGAAALTYLAIMRHPKPTFASTLPLVSIIVAVHAIPARTIIHPPLLHVQRFSLSQIPADAVRLPAEIIGKIALTPIAAGQPLARHTFAAPSAEMGLAMLVTPSFRAVTVALDPVSGVAGFLKPGDHVDVLTTCDAGNGLSVTRTVLQNAALLALGTQTAFAPSPNATEAVNPAANATLMVSPQDAQTLVLAAARGKLQLTLRAPDDPAQTELPVLHSAALAELAPNVPKAPVPLMSSPTPVLPRIVIPAPLPSEITVVKGTDVKTVTVGQ